MNPFLLLGMLVFAVIAGWEPEKSEIVKPNKSDNETPPTVDPVAKTVPVSPSPDTAIPVPNSPES